jgi:hypothetical protein
MHAHIIESRTQARPVDDTPTGHDVAAVGTFASGQSDQGSFYVAADADVGSFASGIQAEAEAEATRSGARVLHPSA